MSEVAGMKVGGKYGFVASDERLTYLGKNWSSNGFWHQFEKEDEPGKVWAECLDSDLHLIKELDNE